MEKIEESRQKALVVCWKWTETYSFFLQIDVAEGHYGSAARIQAKNSMLDGLLGKNKIELGMGKWYQMEYSRYINSMSNTHVLVHEIIIMGAKKRKKSFRARVENGQVQVG
jgi:hypothetical protein